MHNQVNDHISYSDYNHINAFFDLIVLDLNMPICDGCEAF